MAAVTFGMLLCGGVLTAARAAALPGIAPRPTTVPTAPHAAPADPIAARLDAAKDTYQQELTAARAALLSAIDARLNAAATGDPAKAAAASDSMILVELRKAELAVGAARVKLGAAYREAIIQYAQALKPDQAQAVQDEYKKSGLDPRHPAVAGPGRPTTLPATRPSHEPSTPGEATTTNRPFNWQAIKSKVTYTHIKPNFSRHGYAPYIDEPPTRLLDGEFDKQKNQVAWQYVKPNLIEIQFPVEVAPKVIRLYFRGNETDREVNTPANVTVYSSADEATRKKLGGVTDLPNRTGWIDIPLSGRSRTYVLDIPRTKVWTVLGEVEFK